GIRRPAATAALRVEGCGRHEQKERREKNNVFHGSAPIFISPQSLVLGQTKNLVPRPKDQDQSTTSLALRPQENPSAGRDRLTISTRYSPGTRDGRPLMPTLSPTFSESRLTPACAN